MKNYTLKNLSELKNIERISKEVSDKYVPIYTSELVEVLKPEFTFLSGFTFGSNTTKHGVTLKNKSGDKIRIYNSFDGTLAFRVYYVTESLNFSLLDNNRVVHRGDKARNISDKEHLNEIKDSIIKAIPNVKKLQTKLKTLKINTESKIAKVIKAAVFKGRADYYKYKIKDESYEFVNYVDTVAEKAKENGNPLSIYAYINLTVKNFIDGNYGIKHGKTGNVKGGRKVKTAFMKICIINDLTKAIEKNLVEYFI